MCLHVYIYIYIYLFIFLLRTSLNSSAQQAASALRTSVKQMEEGSSAIGAPVSRLSLTVLNHVLYRCDAEERDDGHGTAVYDVPRHGPFKYSGLQGEFMSSQSTQ